MESHQFPSVNKLPACGGDAGAPRPQKARPYPSLQGRFDAGSAIDLLLFLVQTAKTGRLIMTPSGKPITGASCTILMREGKIVHAEFDNCRGHQALWKALNIPEGMFLFYCGDLDKSKTIDENPMSLLLEACRRYDEAAMGLGAAEFTSAPDAVKGPAPARAAATRGAALGSTKS